MYYYFWSVCDSGINALKFAKNLNSQSNVFQKLCKKIPFQLLSKLYHALIKVTFWKFAWNRLHTLHLITACPDTFKLINNMRIFKEESCLALFLSHQGWQHPVLCPLILNLASGKSLLHQKTQSKNLSLSTIQHACLFTELLNLLKILFFFFSQPICRLSLTGLQEPCLNYASLWSSLGLPQSLWSKFPWARIVGFGKSAVTHASSCSMIG